MKADSSQRHNFNCQWWEHISGWNVWLEVADSWEVSWRQGRDWLSSLSVLLVPERVTACPCISWEPLFWVDVGKHQSSRSSVPARRSRIPRSSNRLHWHSQEGGRPAQEQRDSLTSQMVTHTNPARYLGWADSTISPFKDYPLNCPSHTPPSAPAWAFCKDEQYLKERLAALISAPWAVKPILL